MTASLLEHGLELILGLSAVLAVGACAVALARAPIQRFVLARLTLLASWAALALLLLPMPRPGRLSLGRPVLMRAPPVAAAASSAAIRTQAPLARSHPEGPLQAAMLRPGHVHAPAVEQSVELAPLGAESTGAASLDLGPWLVRLGLAIAGALLAHLCLSFILLRRTLRAAQPIGGSAARATRAWASEAGVRTRVLLCARASRPYCCGLWRGTIVLPPSLAQPASRTALEAVMRHELAHLAQRHPAARALAAASAPLLYWNPLYWWLARELRRSAEVLADDTAAAALTKRSYVAELLSLAEHPLPSIPASGLGVLGPRREFLLRMETLLMRNHRLMTRTSKLQTLGRGLGAAMLLGSVSLAWGRAPQQSENPFFAPRERVQLADSLAQEADPEQNVSQVVPIADSQIDPRALSPLGARSAFQWRWNDALDCALSIDDIASLGRFLIAAQADGIDVTELKMSAAPKGELRATLRIENSTLETIVEVSRAEPGVSVVACAPAAHKSADHVTQGKPFAFGGTRSVTYALEPNRIRYVPSEQPDPVVDLGPPINGTVLKVAVGEQKTLVTLNRGSEAGVTEGMVFELYGGSIYKGRMTVTSVAKTSCSGVLTSSHAARAVVAGDKATTHL